MAFQARVYSQCTLSPFSHKLFGQFVCMLGVFVGQASSSILITHSIGYSPSVDVTKLIRRRCARANIAR